MTPQASPAPSRLDAAPRPRACTECGAAYASGSAHAEFCGQACRRAWNNRRAVRGAELYDLLMALRFDRAAATRLKVWRIVCRLLSAGRREDLDQRGGRRSWRDPAQIIARRPYLVATIVARGVAGRRRGR